MPDFNREIAPLLATHCVKCHGDAEPKGGLDLRTKEAMLKGGDSGPALTAGSADESLLFDLVSRGEMPPKRERRLSAAQVALIKDWLNAGAPGPGGGGRREPGDNESGQGTRSRALGVPGTGPAGRAVRPGPRRVRTPVDAFVLARLEAKGLDLLPRRRQVGPCVRRRLPST